MWEIIVILSMIQGITEFLPISSSAHLILFPKFFTDTTTNRGFDVALHFGTLLAVIIYLKKDMSENSYQITYSKIGKFIGDENSKILKLYDGQTINYVNDKISKFNFQSSDFSLANLDASIIPVNKTQETSTNILRKT